MCALWFISLFVNLWFLYFWLLSYRDSLMNHDANKNFHHSLIICFLSKADKNVIFYQFLPLRCQQILSANGIAWPSFLKCRKIPSKNCIRQRKSKCSLIVMKIILNSFSVNLKWIELLFSLFFLRKPIASLVFRYNARN